MILVTGGTGLIGRTLVNELLKKRKKVRVLSLDPPPKKGRMKCEYVTGDITDYDSVLKAAEGCSAIFHLAALVSYDAHKISQKKYDIVNVGGTLNVLKAAQEVGAKVVFMSSVAAARMDTKYSISKNRAEKLVKSYSDKVKTIIIRSAPVYGPESPKFDKLMKYMEKGVIGRIGKDLKTHLVDKDTLVKALIRASEKGKTGETYVIADTKPILMSELYSLLAKGLNVEEKHYPYWVAYLGAVAFEIRSILTGKRAPLTRDYLLTLTLERDYDISKAVTEIGYKSITTETGVEKMLKWYKAKD